MIFMFQSLVFICCIALLYLSPERLAKQLPADTGANSSVLACQPAAVSDNLHPQQKGESGHMSLKTAQNVTAGFYAL